MPIENFGYSPPATHPRKFDRTGKIGLMQPSIEKLQKFFKLEADMGYNNRAVIGGFEQIAGSWEAEARADGIPEELVQTISERLRNYASLSPTSRQETLQGLWRRIQRSYEDEPDIAATESAAVQNQVPATVPASKDSESPVAREKSPPQRVEAPVPPTVKQPPLPADEPPAALNASITTLKGIGPKHAQMLAQLGIHNLGDMLYYFPRRYIDYSNLKPINRLWYGEEVTVIGTVENVQMRSIKGGKMQVIEALLGDGTGMLRLTWFNQHWIVTRLQRNPHISVSGKIDQYLGRLVMYSPEWEPLTQQQLHTNRIVPVYPLTAKITQNLMRKQMNSAVTFWAPRLLDPLPDELRQQAGLMGLPSAVLQVHFPDSWEHLEAARHRIAFDEILYLQLGVLSQKRAWETRPGRVLQAPDEWVDELLARLPFQLTSAQRSALHDLRQDLASGSPMNRLLQGDVGSGKTVVAALAAAITAQENVQSALMAPTSILAEQHFRSLQRFLVNDMRVVAAHEVRLMIGATPESEKEEIRAGLANGEIKIAVGTHALIEDPVQFADLELVIIDEQHRFGVDQRGALRSKGTNPHLLVMTATPIPRSLALSVYGDLDLSVMDEMPPGRQEIETYILHPAERERAYSLIRSQVAEGRQVFIIYPLVEESEKSDAMAAVEESERLQASVFPELQIGLLHGRLRPDEKEAVMARFRDGEYQILVSTSVVEVGVDIPNATVMLIEGANKFGLAQLHQFRGRVGRGGNKSYCLLIPDSSDAVENERLAAMVETNDGFVLAEIDLEQRGPGDFLGTRQSGFADLRMASLTDVHLIEKARHFAQEIFTSDPDLEAAEHARIKTTMQRMWSLDGSGDIS
jgi:ATP-dependent DNA helicase RecG